MTLTQGTEKFSLLFCCLPDILLSVDLCVPVCAPSRRTVAAVAAVFILRVCCVIHIPPLPSSVNYLFRLLRVRIKRDRAPGSTARDGMTFRTDCRMAESTHALIDALSKTMWIRRRGDRAVPNQGQPHPGEIVLLLLLRENSQNRKVWNCKLFVNAERLLRQHWASLNGSQKNRFLMRLAGFGVCDGRSVPRTDPQRQGRSSPTPARRRADSCQRSR